MQLIDHQGSGYDNIGSAATIAGGTNQAEFIAALSPMAQQMFIGEQGYFHQAQQRHQQMMALEHQYQQAVSGRHLEDIYTIDTKQGLLNANPAMQRWISASPDIQEHYEMGYELYEGCVITDQQVFLDQRSIWSGSMNMDTGVVKEHMDFFHIEEEEPLTVDQQLKIRSTHDFIRELALNNELVTLVEENTLFT